MLNNLLLLGVATWIVAGLLALGQASILFTRLILTLGSITVLVFAVLAVSGGTEAVHIPLGMGPAGSVFQLAPEANWLLGFGLPGATLASWLGSPTKRQSAWLFGMATSLIGALGVFGLQNAVGFLVSWEIMSLGGAIMLLGENLSPDRGRSVLFMLGLLETGAVALILAFLLVAQAANSVSFTDIAAAAKAMPTGEQLFIGFLFVIGFGAKLGILPFYEWFPAAYGAGSGATGAILSGIILNAAFFGLSRVFTQWLPVHLAFSVSVPGIFLVIVAVVTAIFTALYAFQQDSWRELLSLSSAENGAIAVCLLGLSLMFQQDNLPDFAGLAWTVALLHLAGHALAKGCLFLCADGVYRAAGNYELIQTGILGRSLWIFGLGALFGAMSLAAMPPQAGFVSEWYMFQSFFQGFHLSSLASRLTAALAGAGLALTVAIGFATYIKVLGIGLLGRSPQNGKPVPLGNSLAVGALGLLVLVLAAGMPIWVRSLDMAVMGSFGSSATAQMQDSWVLVPLTAKFAFISPSKLVIVMPLLALIPIILFALSAKGKTRRVPVWYGGREQDPNRSATTALTFSNALRTFYSFIYRPTIETERETAGKANGHTYFITKLNFTHDVAPIFGPYLFAPLERLVLWASSKLRTIQSGHLNFYLSLVGVLLIAILFIALL